MTDLSIVIVSYNTRDILRDCLASLPAGCGDLTTETFVVDNASADGSADMVEREFAGVTLVRQSTNPGFAAGNNVALERATGRYVCLLNPDTVARPLSLQTLVRFMDKHPGAGYCGPRLLNPDGSHQPSARRFPTTLTAAYNMLGVSRRRPESRHTMDMHAAHPQGEFRADWLSGACLIARATAIKEVGLLDAGFFLYFEETDWCRRMASAGWEGWFVPSAEVVHLGGQSVGSVGDGRPFHGDHPVFWVRSSRRYMRRHLGWTRATLSEIIQIKLYGLIWLRHRWRRSQQSRNKAHSAAASIGYLLNPGRHDRNPRTAG